MDGPLKLNYQVKVGIIRKNKTAGHFMTASHKMQLTKLLILNFTIATLCNSLCPYNIP
ncbi:MAG: hypothetical protein OFPI_09030 [Osedax symbiont Rs2]|nr:MAG: hypothetical protein OFPI_09030 [Osedax symbiont Rs2]